MYKRPVIKWLLPSLLALLSIPGFAQHNEHSIAYSIGVVPQFEQRKLFKIWQPVITALEKRTGFSLHLVGSPKIPVFEKKFLAGEYDFAYMNPYHVLKAHKSQGYVPLVRDGSRRLKGVLVVNKQSPIQSIKQLDGKIIAFPAPNALGASLMMRADLVNLHGINFSPRYVQTHSSVYLNVALGQAVAGGGVMSTLKAQSEAVQERLRVIYETRSLAPHPFAVHARVPQSHRDIMQKAWLDLAATVEGQALLEKIPMRESVAADMEDYKSMETWGLDAFYVVD